MTERVTRFGSSLAELFTLARTDEHVWMSGSELLSLPRLFGGQLVGQSIMAAGHSIEDSVPGTITSVDSIHTTFLSPGISGVPVEFEVSPTQAGRTRVSRQVSAMQNGNEVCRSFVSASVHTQRAPSGVSHARPAPDGGTPENAISLRDIAEPDGGLGSWWGDFGAMEIRIAPIPAAEEHKPETPRNIWMRATAPLPDHPLVQRATVAFASDLMLLGIAAAPHGVPFGWENTLTTHWWGISLDHTMWFYNDIHGDEWLVYEHTTPMAHNSRALVQAAAFDLSGNPVCQIAQETLLRRQRPSQR